MKGCRNTAIFIFLLVTIFVLIVHYGCGCRGKEKEVKPGVYLDSVYSPLEAPLRIKNDTSTWIHRKCTPGRASRYITGGTKDSVDNYSGYNLNLLNKSDSIIIQQPGKGHVEWIYPLGNGDTLRYGYAKISRGGLPTLRWKEVRFGIDSNKIHRLFTITRDSALHNLNK